TNLVCAVIFCRFVIGVGTMSFLNGRTKSALAEREAKAEVEYAQAAQRIKQVQEMQEKQKRMARQAELTASLLEQVPRRYLLAEFTNALPAGVSLLDFSLSSLVRQTQPQPTTEFGQKQAALKPAPAEVRPR